MPLNISSNKVEISKPSVGMNRMSIYSETYKMYLGQSAVYPALRNLLNTNDANGYKYGDTNNDGAINLTDVLNALKWYLNQSITSSYTQAVKDRLDAIAAIMAANKATYQADGSWYPDTVVFSTDYRMPHIISSVSGTYTVQSSPITLSGGTVTVQDRQEVYVDSSSNYQFQNSFVWAYIKPLVNGERTDIDVGSPIFLAGTINLRLYIQDSGYRGCMLLTPQAFNGHIGFVQEHTYYYTGTVPPSGLYPDPGNTYSQPGIQLAYTLYYGRFS